MIHPTRRDVMKAAACCAATAALSSVSAAQQPRRPNIVIVLTDDQGYGELGCHGNPIIRTPSIDRLHAESVRFTDFHVSPTCAPTRCSLLTGRHEFRSGITHTILERERMSLKSTTLAQVLKGAGYTTGIFGKWHLGDEEAYRPERRGFDEVFIHGAGGIGQTYPGSGGDAPGNKYHDPAIYHNGTFEKTTGYCTDVFFAQALKWMDGKRQKGEPFLAYITPNAPHGPYISPGPEYDKLYEGKELSKDAAAYYAMITNIDDNVGKLREKLREWKIEQDTLLIFMTDNGHSIGTLYNAGMRAAKGSPHQGGTRVPSFWCWPGTLKGGVDVPALTAHIDVLPTLAGLTGAKLPDVKLDGRSLQPLLSDPKATWPDRYLFTHVGRWGAGKVADAKHTRCAVRNTRFRLINNAELYDIQADPGEKTNVIDQHPDVVAAMRKAYDQWWEEILPCLENENVTGPKINPFKELYWKQFGGGPTEQQLKQMDPAGKFAPGRW